MNSVFESYLNWFKELIALLLLTMLAFHDYPDPFAYTFVDEFCEDLVWIKFHV